MSAPHAPRLLGLRSCLLHCAAALGTLFFISGLLILLSKLNLLWNPPANDSGTVSVTLGTLLTLAAYFVLILIGPIFFIREHAIMSGSELFNLWESALWSWLGVILLAHWWRRRGHADAKPACLAGLLLIAFAISDRVEMQTGAWWDPWWLFAWKAICAIGILGSFCWWKKL